MVPRAVGRKDSTASLQLTQMSDSGARFRDSHFLLVGVTTFAICAVLGTK